MPRHSAGWRRRNVTDPALTTVTQKVPIYIQSHFRQGKEVNPTALRDALGEVLFDIRFPIMDGKEFARGPAKSGILMPEVSCSRL